MNKLFLLLRSDIIYIKKNRVTTILKNKEEIIKYFKIRIYETKEN